MSCEEMAAVRITPFLKFLGVAGLAAEAADCDPDDGWYPDTGELEDLLDEVEDLAGQEPDARRRLLQ